MENSTTPSIEELQKRAFLLNQFMSAPGRQLARSNVKKNVTASITRQLGMTKAETDALCEQMAAEQLLVLEKNGRSVDYVLRDAGATYFESIKSHLPAIAPSARNSVMQPENEQIRDARNWYLLLQLLQAPKQTLAQSAANRLDSLGRHTLKLNAPTALLLRHELAARGYITIAGKGRKETYTLTPEGRMNLGNMAFLAEPKFTFTGEALNLLLDAAREVAKQFEPQSTKTPARTLPFSDDLEKAILSTFEELRREKYADSGLAPIHEIRAAIRNQIGESAGRHDVFDEALRQLHRGNRLRLIPIADPTMATDEQLQDSIPGIGETLFYLDAAPEPVTV